MHKITDLYKIIYNNSKKLSKGDKLGIRAKTERACLECLELSVQTALAAKNQKLPSAEKLKIQIEVLKQLIRLELDLQIVPETFYTLTQEKLQEISRMTTGWIKYLQQKEPA